MHAPRAVAPYAKVWGAKPTPPQNRYHVGDIWCHVGAMLGTFASFEWEAIVNILGR